MPRKPKVKEAVPPLAPQIRRIGSNHPARVNKEYLTSEKLKEAARARKMEYISPLRAIHALMVG